MIGEAVHKKKSFNHEIPTIGILPWGMVNNKHNLIEKNEVNNHCILTAIDGAMIML